MRIKILICKSVIIGYFIICIQDELKNGMHRSVYRNVYVVNWSISPLGCNVYNQTTRTHGGHISGFIYSGRYEQEWRRASEGVSVGTSLQRPCSGGGVVSEPCAVPQKMYVSCSNRVRHGGYPTAACRQIFYQVGRGKDKYVISTYVCVHFSQETQKKKKP